MRRDGEVDGRASGRSSSGEARRHDSKDATPSVVHERRCSASGGEEHEEEAGSS